MKIVHMYKNSEKETLNELLNNYRDTPHPATGYLQQQYYLGMVNE